MILFILTFTAIYIFYYVIASIKNKNKFNARRNKYKKLKANLDKIFINNNSINDILINLNLGIDYEKYQIFRYSTFMLLLFYCISDAFLKNYVYSQKHILLLLLLFFITSPQKYIYGKKTFFLFIIEYIQKQIDKEKNEEIYRAIGQLRNLAIARKDNPPSGSFYLEQIIRFTNKTKPMFNQFMKYWNMNNKTAASDYFVKNINLKESRDIVNLFIKLDDLNPSELISQLSLFQDKFRKQRLIEKQKKNENISYILYSSVIFSALIVLLNFVIVAFWIDNVKLLQYSF